MVTVKFLTQSANYFMNAFLAGTKDASPSIRASSLSNLAQLCKALRFALHPYITEILSCIQSLLGSEKDSQVRSGAVFVLALLFQGLGTDILTLIPDELSQTYRLLKQIAENHSEDQVTKFHTQIAL